LRSECIRDFIQKTRYSITRLTCFEIAHGLPVFTAAGGERYNPGQSMTLASGIRLGPYEIQTRLGAGGMGEVYRAHDTRLGRDVAVKVLPQHLSCNPELKARFEREARAISALSDPHICHLYDIGSQGGTDFLVMELLDGESLADSDKGQLAGDGLPPGCDDENICGHEFLLIPCAAGQGCEGTDDGNARTSSPAITTNAATPTQRRRMTKEFVAQLRARLAQRYHIRGLRASPRD